LFGDSIDEDVEVILDGSYKWLRRLGEHHFFHPRHGKDVLLIVHPATIALSIDGVGPNRGTI